MKNVTVLYFIVLYFSYVPNVLSQSSPSYDEKFMFDNVGITYMQPFLKRGFESRTPWYGVSGGTGELDFGFFMGNVYKKDQSIDTGFVKQGWMLRAGYRFDFSKKKYRPLSVFQFRAIPLLSVSLAFSKAGGPSEYITLPLSYGLNVSPGIRIKASVFHLDLKPEINFMYARVRGFRTNPENAFAGFVFTPTVTLGIDGIFDVFTPKHMNERYDYIKLNTDVQKYSTEKYELVYNLYAGGGSGYAKVRREYTITTYSYEPAVMFFDLHLTKPFFSITPIVEFYPKTHFREETRQFGGQFNSWIGCWKFGAFAKAGNIGTKSPFEEDRVATMLPNNRNLSFSATIPVLTAGVTIGFNPSQYYAAKRIGKGLFYYVNYHRLYFNAQFLYSQFDVAQARYANIEANDYYYQIVDNSNIKEVEKSDLSLLPESALGWALGANLEMGAASLSLNRTMYPNAKMANYTSLKLEANIPYIKLGKTFSAIRKTKKLMKEDKMK